MGAGEQGWEERFSERVTAALVTYASQYSLLGRKYSHCNIKMASPRGSDTVRSGVMAGYVEIYSSSIVMFPSLPGKQSTAVLTMRSSRMCSMYIISKATF